MDENDWDGTPEAAENVGMQHPNMLAWLNEAQWVSSDDDISRAIKLLADVQIARRKVALAKNQQPA